MPSKISREILGKVVAEVLEEASFIFTEPAEEIEPFDGGVIVALMGFDGPEKGKLVLAMGYDYAVEMAANLLGVEPDDPELEKKATGAVAEMLNMIIGVLMARVFGPEAVVNFTVPSVKTIDGPDYEKIRESATVAFSLLTEDMSKIEAAAFVE